MIEPSRISHIHPFRTLQLIHLTASAGQGREAESDVAIRVRPQIVARHRQATASVLGLAFISKLCYLVKRNVRV